MEIYKKFISFDPGKHTGWALFIDGIMKEFGTVYDEAEIYPFIFKLPKDLDLIVCEDYKIRDKEHGGFDHQWQSVFPAQVIGAIRFYALIRGIPVVMQQPSIKSAACPMLTGKPYKKQASKHHWDAFLHGGYYVKTQKG